MVDLKDGIVVPVREILAFRGDVGASYFGPDIADPGWDSSSRDMDISTKKTLYPKLLKLRGDAGSYV